jgi:hypothetical protein
MTMPFDGPNRLSAPEIENYFRVPHVIRLPDFVVPITGGRVSKAVQVAQDCLNGLKDPHRPVRTGGSQADHTSC